MSTSASLPPLRMSCSASSGKVKGASAARPSSSFSSSLRGTSSAAVILLSLDVTSHDPSSKYARKYASIACSTGGSPSTCRPDEKSLCSSSARYAFSLSQYSIIMFSLTMYAAHRSTASSPPSIPPASSSTFIAPSGRGQSLSSPAANIVCSIDPSTVGLPSTLSILEGSTVGAEDPANCCIRLASSSCSPPAPRLSLERPSK
mmetsp:Transcript_1224/g.3784  ORF Transcript_1224/g.3784 Transcript_1224/m.3784 type:complete len:203 (-) Transcript_1224:2590-3198(-)